MDRLMRKAIKTLEENPTITEITLSDGINEAHLVRPASPVVTWNYHYPSEYKWNSLG